MNRQFLKWTCREKAKLKDLSDSDELDAWIRESLKRQREEDKAVWTAVGDAPRRVLLRNLVDVTYTHYIYLNITAD